MRPGGNSLPPSGLTLRPRSLGAVLQVRGVQHSLHSEEVGPLCARVVSVCVHPRQARQWPPLVGVFSCHGWLRPPPEVGSQWHFGVSGGVLVSAGVHCTAHASAMTDRLGPFHGCLAQTLATGRGVPVDGGHCAQGGLRAMVTAARHAAGRTHTRASGRECRWHLPPGRALVCRRPAHPLGGGPPVCSPASG